MSIPYEQWLGVGTILFCIVVYLHISSNRWNRIYRRYKDIFDLLYAVWAFFYLIPLVFYVGEWITLSLILLFLGVRIAIWKVKGK
jgi:ABC-type proline/glycine betaine transport system permease subunit